MSYMGKKRHNEASRTHSEDVVALTPPRHWDQYDCADCGREVKGKSYSVGFTTKREVCPPCFVTPRMPPMKPIGDAFHVQLN